MIRYDERGNGMSDWDVTDFGLEPRVADLEAVADAAGLERFAMVGMSQGGPVGVAYAARHPRRLTRLILYGTYGRAMDPPTRRPGAGGHFEQIIKVGWGRPDSTFRRVFTHRIPGSVRGAGGLARRPAGPSNLARTPCGPAQGGCGPTSAT